MSKPSDSAEPTPPSSLGRPLKTGVEAVTHKDFLSLANLLTGKDSVQRVHKKDSHGEALRAAAQLYENREFVASYECLKPAHDKVVSDMQRVLARNPEFEAKKLTREQRMSLAAAKSNVEKMKVHAQQVIDQLGRLLQDLESKPLVRVHIKKGRPAAAPARQPAEDAPPTMLTSTSETQVDTRPAAVREIASGNKRYSQAPYSPPEIGTLYSVRDKAGRERIIRVIGINPDGTQVQIEMLEEGEPAKQPIQLAVASLIGQAAKGWCNVLLAIAESADVPTVAGPLELSSNPTSGTLRLDIQNFGRCCADIARANIKYSTQLIKDVGDGPFRAGNYDKAFQIFEQLSIGFGAAVASSRRAITNGRRTLTAQKEKLSGKEIQEQTAAFIRNEQLIHTAERAFSAILEGLRMYLRARDA